MVFSPTHQGINHFIDLFKVPLSLLGLNIPLMALVASLHKSAQTLVQIKLSHRHSLFSNHNAHFNLFNTYIDQSRIAEHVKHRFDDHRNLFKNIHNGVYSICTSIQSEVDSRILKFLSGARDYLGEAHEMYKSSMESELCAIIVYICKLIGIDYSKISFSITESDKLFDIFERLRTPLSSYEILCNFDGTFKSSISVQWLLSYRPSQDPIASIDLLIRRINEGELPAFYTEKADKKLEISI